MNFLPVSLTRPGPPPPKAAGAPPAGAWVRFKQGQGCYPPVLTGRVLKAYKNFILVRTHPGGYAITIHKTDYGAVEILRKGGDGP